MQETDAIRAELVRISHLFYHRGWVSATSGNFSVRLNGGHILITESGRDKGKLTEDQLILVDLNGKAASASQGKPSAEATLHCALYSDDPTIGAVIHTHSVFSTVLSSLPQLKAPVILENYEMLKAFSQVESHNHSEQLPVFANHQDMSVLSNVVVSYKRTSPAIHGFLISAHGLYTWAKDLSEALKHTEAFEFLLECEYRKLVTSL